MPVNVVLDTFQLLAIFYPFLSISLHLYSQSETLLVKPLFFFSLKMIYTADDRMCVKSKRMNQLDEELGDIKMQIIDKETTTALRFGKQLSCEFCLKTSEIGIGKSSNNIRSLQRCSCS